MVKPRLESYAKQERKLENNEKPGWLVVHKTDATSGLYPTIFESQAISKVDLPSALDGAHST